MEENKKQDTDAEIGVAAHTEPLPGRKAPDANVDVVGNCILTQDGEMARPDSGDPCDEGLGG